MLDAMAAAMTSPADQRVLHARSATGNRSRTAGSATPRSPHPAHIRRVATAAGTCGMRTLSSRPIAITATRKT